MRDEIKEKSFFETFMGWVLYFSIIFVLTYLIVTYVGQRTRVKGSSMEPMLSDGDQLMVDKISYRFQDPKRYDIIVFPYSKEEKVYYIKRIIGMPGETVQIIDGSVYIDGTLLGSEVYGAEAMDFPGLAEVPVTLGEDEYFVLGDNRNHSSDSRDSSVGVLKRKELIGRAFVRIYPFKRAKVIEHER